MSRVFVCSRMRITAAPRSRISQTTFRSTWQWPRARSTFASGCAPPPGSDWQDEARLARAMAQLALALEQQGDNGAALSQLNRAHSTLDAALTRAGLNQMLQRGLAEIRSRRAPVLLALDRGTEAASEAQSAVDLLQPLVSSDPQNIQDLADLAYAWLRLGDARAAQGQLDEALALHRRALVDTPRARRPSCRLHLRALGTHAQSQQCRENCC